MFQFDRVKDDLILRVNYKAFLIGAFTLLVSLIGVIWVFWVMSIKIEMRRIRHEVYAAVSSSLGDVIGNTVKENYSNLLRLEQCMAESIQLKEVNKDLVKMSQKNSGVAK